jgi:hypothetical protein
MKPADDAALADDPQDLDQQPHRADAGRIALPRQTSDVDPLRRRSADEERR